VVSTNVCVAGATGWTGRAIAAAVHEAPDLTLRTAVSRSAAGTDLGSAWGGPPIDVRVHADVANALDGVDVLVDYTSHLAVLDHALAVTERGSPSCHPWTRGHGAARGRPRVAEPQLGCVLPAPTRTCPCTGARRRHHDRGI
jgi:hypothetical protein